MCSKQPLEQTGFPQNCQSERKSQQYISGPFEVIWGGVCLDELVVVCHSKGVGADACSAIQSGSILGASEGTNQEDKTMLDACVQYACDCTMHVEC